MLSNLGMLLHHAFCEVKTLSVYTPNNSVFQATFLTFKTPTMPAKSLGTLAMNYAIVELQNPLPRKTMLGKGDMNISASTSDTFLQR